MRKTPALTTATAWSSAETGVGATIAAGSQKCIGMTAALAMPKTKRASSTPMATGAELAGEDAAGVEIERAGGDAGPGDRRQQQQGRGAEQHQQIEAAGGLGLLVAAMGDQRIGDQRQHLVEEESVNRLPESAMPMVAAMASAKQT